MHSHVSSLEELQAFTESLLVELRDFAGAHEGAVVLAISGDLGAGKTTFVQYLAKLLGVSQVVTSPTFTIMKGYEVSIPPFAQLIHMDAYRIEDLEELRPLRLKEILESPKTLVCIEWAERIAPVLPADVWQLSFTTHPDGMRHIEVTPPQK